MNIHYMTYYELNENTKTVNTAIRKYSNYID